MVYQAWAVRMVYMERLDGRLRLHLGRPLRMPNRGNVALAVWAVLPSRAVLAVGSQWNIIRQQCIMEQMVILESKVQVEHRGLAHVSLNLSMGKTALMICPESLMD